jgi:anti-anti-sigma factor
MSRYEGRVLKLEVQESPLVTIIRCSGRMVYGEGIDTLAKAVLSRDTRYFLIDFIGVNAIDAAGLGALANLERWARSEKRTLHLANLSKRVRQALETTGMTRVLQIFLESAPPRRASGVHSLPAPYYPLGTGGGSFGFTTGR